MRQNILSLIFVASLLVSGFNEMNAQERPKLREVGDRKYDIALKGVVPVEKKDKVGYADSQGKFIIPAIFHNAMPMSDMHVGFVSFLDEAGKEYWTPISLKGLYLTELNFSEVIKDFDERGLAVVRQENKYGIVSHTGKMVVGCNYQHFEDKTPVYLLHSNAGGCIAVAKDETEKGYTSYSFAAQEPIIVKAEGGYGIISHKNYFVVADFVYDSVKELVNWEAYCLQKGQKKYLYAADKLSMGYEDVISCQGGAYFVVKFNGKYGILTTDNEVLLSCSQDEIPVLKKNEYACLYENGSPVYLTIGRKATPSEYDDYLYTVKHKGVAAEYMLDQTLALENKKYIKSALSACYGNKNFDLVSHLDVAKEYAENRRFVLLSNDTQNARFYDLESKSFVNCDDVLYHAFPSKSGAPAYASVLKYGKFGIMDIRNGRFLLEAVYDNVTPLGNGYAALQKADSLYLYSVSENLMVTAHGCEAINETFLDLNLVKVKQGGEDRFYSLADHRWTLPSDHTLMCVAQIPSKDSLVTAYAALMKNGAKGALYDVCSGEKLTEYLFDGVEEELFAGKYNVVVVAGKKGLYDAHANKFVTSCDCAKIENYYQFNDAEFAVVVKAGKKGVHNLTTNKLVISAQNDEIDMRGGYARLRRAGKYYVYSLQYNKMVFPSSVEYVELMDDGYALLQGPDREEKGVFNLNWSEWYIDPIPGHDMCFLGGNYVGVANKGVGNYKTNKMALLTDDDSIDSFLEVNGNYVLMTDPVEGAYMWMYKLDNPDFHLGASNIDVLTSSNTSMSDRNLAIIHDYRYNDGWEITNVLRCRLLDLDNDKEILSDSFDGCKFMEMAYIDPGLISVTFETGNVWLFDIYTEAWVLKESGKMKSRSVGKYFVFTFEDGEEYMFDPTDREMIQMSDNFGLRDYLRYKEARSLVPASALTGCDRVSIMYAPQLNE